MRIVGGIFKGKKLFLPIDKNTRPLKDIVKESIFNIIKHSNHINVNIKDSYILDLFSGSGSFGLECISREAKKVFFLENHPNALKILIKNLNNLKNFQNYKIIENDCFEFLDNDRFFDNKFNIIFLDPPYKELRINNLIDKIISKKLLALNGLIIIHRHKKDPIEISKKFKIIEEREYGISKIYFGN
tara:strand:+ start:1780 stop:2340 length:561 start_codon:yes stop_codon:yes gene_type:complete